MKNILSILILPFLIFSCENNQDKIEIYLLKNRIRTSEGIPSLEYMKLKNIKYDENLEFVKNCNYDSISKQFIFGGKFKVNKENLKAEPLITDENIIKLKIKNNELILSDYAKNKISNLKPDMKYGIQFAICVNREPVLTGYFRSVYSSIIYNWNYIAYDNYNKQKNVVKDSNYIIRQNEGYVRWKPKLTDLSKYPELIKALNKSNRVEN